MIQDQPAIDCLRSRDDIQASPQPPKSRQREDRSPLALSSALQPARQSRCVDETSRRQASAIKGGCRLSSVSLCAGTAEPSLAETPGPETHTIFPALLAGCSPVLQTSTGAVARQERLSETPGCFVD